jgi:hypothetical protein
MDSTAKDLPANEIEKLVDDVCDEVRHGHR